MSQNTLRQTAMDAQRFDPSKHQKASHAIDDSAPWASHSKKTEKALRKSKSLVSCLSSAGVFGSGWEDRAIAVLASIALPCHSKSTTVELPPSIDEPLRSPTSSTSSATLVVERTAYPTKHEVHCTDVFEHEEHIITRTIIRPTRSRSNLLGVSLKSSSEHLNAARSRSPLGSRLNCIGKTDAFEEEVDLIQQEREKQHTGAQEVRIRVYEERCLVVEEKWRDAVGAMLYERAPAVDSVVGHVEAF